MSKRSTAYEKGESSKPLERPKTPGAYESSTLDNHNDAFVEDGSKDELGERTCVNEVNNFNSITTVI